MTSGINPDLDLELTVQTPLTAEQLFDGWTQPDLLMQWFCPRPWRVIACQIDLRPGGLFANTMQSPEGQTLPENRGCYLVVERPYRLVWTGLMAEDYRPNAIDALGFGFVCLLDFTPLPQGGSTFHAVVKHATAADREKHAQMGFEKGWGLALSQLIELYQAGTA